jgi:hypothetical protein
MKVDYSFPCIRWALSWAGSIQSTPSHITFKINLFHLCLDLQNDPFSSGFSTNLFMRFLSLRRMIHTRMYPKVPGLAAWSKNCKRYSSLPLGAVVSLFCESVLWVLPPYPLCCFPTSVYCCCFFPYRFSPETFGYTLAPHPYHPPWFYHTNNIWYRVETMKSLVISFFFSSLQSRSPPYWFQIFLLAPCSRKICFYLRVRHKFIIDEKQQTKL